MAADLAGAQRACSATPSAPSAVSPSAGTPCALAVGAGARTVAAEGALTGEGQHLDAASDSAVGAMAAEWVLPFPLDLVRTLSVHRRGGGDPTFRIDETGAVWRTSLTPDGPATVRIHAAARSALQSAGVREADGAPAGPPAGFPAVGVHPAAAVMGAAVMGAAVMGAAVMGGAVVDAAVVDATAWGPGARWLLESVPSLLGAGDDPAGFDPLHPVLRRVLRRHRGVRLGRSGRVMEALVPAVLEQKVVGAEAWRAWRILLGRFGDPAPGPAPAGMRVFPQPSVWARIPSWEWHRAGAEAVRARTIIGAAMVASRLEEITAMPSGHADRVLRTLPGIGVWTSAEIRQRACGDPDAVSVGDYHLPGAVGWVLAGRKVDDAGMLELLAPYAGHRHRVTRLVELSGLRPPRRGPRFAPRDYRSF